MDRTGLVQAPASGAPLAEYEVEVPLEPMSAKLTIVSEYWGLSRWTLESMRHLGNPAVSVLFPRMCGPALAREQQRYSRFRSSRALKRQS